MTVSELGLEHLPAQGEAEEPEPPLLELRGIRKQWPRMEQPVLDGIDLDLDPATVTWVGGRNGIGKTTLLRIATGLICADSGTVSLDGLDPVADRRAYQTKTGFLSAANNGLYNRLPTRWHLDWWARIAFVDKARRPAVVADVLERFDLDGLARQRVERMSMGQRQRLRLAGVFLHDPEVILLDEPRNSLDTEGVEILAAAVARAVDRGAAVLWCAPTGEDENILTDRRFVLEHGRLVPA